LGGGGGSSDGLCRSYELGHNVARIQAGVLLLGLDFSGSSWEAVASWLLAGCGGLMAFGWASGRLLAGWLLARLGSLPLRPQLEHIIPKPPGNSPVSASLGGQPRLLE